jgi:hypothetical protein
MVRNLGGKPIEQNGNKEAWRAHVREEARRWFFGSSDFEWWCEQAGFEPEYVREKARLVLENGLPESGMRRQSVRLPLKGALHA